MIYNKEANFPYPVLSYLTKDYPDDVFEFSVSLEDKGNDYGFRIKYNLTSSFINDLLHLKKAKIYLVIESQDVKFYELTKDFYLIPKSRISLSKKSSFQLFICSNTRISFRDNSDLDLFFKPMQNKIFISKGKVLAYSNVEKFVGDLKKPYEIFSFSVDKTLKSDIQVRLEPELIHIVYRTNELRYSGISGQASLNYHYVYLGLQKALLKFIHEQKEDIVYINDVDEVQSNLSHKLVTLMKLKHVEQVGFENLDEVIYKISDNIVDKHCKAVRGLSERL
jgi:hypothetical protein